MSAEAGWLADLIECLTSLVQTLALRDDWVPAEDSPQDPFTAWSRLDSSVNHYESLEALLQFADRTIQAATEVFPESVAVRHAGLGFYEAAVELPLEAGIPVVVLPGAAFAYACLVGDEVAGVARMCGVVAR